jgi:gas vesicle protein
VGLLFAPQKGEETRKKVSEWLDQSKEKIKGVREED